jgi:AcrR family transcriptional regulator
VAVEPGLRERKKQQTRRLIYETASRLFAERGFDAVTVAEVARHADVSEVTVFNYFPTKEDLFFGGMEFFEERLLEAVRRRSAGESVLAAFLELLLQGSSRLAVEDNAEVIARAARIIGASPALQARERAVVARYTAQLAELLAEETGASRDDVEAFGVANALMGLHRALVGYVRAAVLAGRHGPHLAADFRTRARRAFGRLETGLAGYAVKGAKGPGQDG